MPRRSLSRLPAKMSKRRPAPPSGNEVCNVCTRAKIEAML